MTRLVDARTDAYVEELAALDPLTATYAGVPGHDHRLPDLSPAGLDAVDDDGDPRGRIAGRARGAERGGHHVLAVARGGHRACQVGRRVEVALLLVEIGRAHV